MHKADGRLTKGPAFWQAGVLHGWLHLNTKPRIDTVAHGHFVQWGYMANMNENKKQKVTLVETCLYC